MGNKSSAGSISVTFDNADNLTPGSEVQGKVSFTILEDIPCRSIGGRVVGQEVTKVAIVGAPSVVGDNPLPSLSTKQRRTFLDLEFCLATVNNNRLVQGHHLYPFHFTLPKDVPASMVRDFGGESCKVKYHMEVRISNSGTFSKYKVQHKQRFQVQTTPPVGVTEAIVVEPRLHKVTKMGLVNDGGVFFGARLNANNFSPGENCTVQYGVANQSTTSIKAIEITLNEQITFQAAGLFTNKVHQLYKRKVAAQDTGLDLTPLTAATETNDAVLLQRVRDALHAGNSQVEFTIPATAQCTLYGEIITITHSLRIELITAFGSSNPKIERDVTVYSKPAPAPMAVEVLRPPVARVPSVTARVWSATYETDVPTATAVPLQPARVRFNLE